MSDEVLRNIYEAIQSFWPLISIAGKFLGVVMVILAGLNLWHVTKTGQGSKGVSLGLVVGGILLVNIEVALRLFSNSVLGSSPGEWGFSATAAAGPGQNYVLVALSAIKLVGAVGFVRGCYLLGQSSRDAGGGNVWFAIVHLVGGTVALNVETFAVMLGNTLGGTLGTTINQLLGG